MGFKSTFPVLSIDSYVLFNDTVLTANVLQYGMIYKHDHQC